MVSYHEVGSQTGFPALIPKGSHMSATSSTTITDVRTIAVHVTEHDAAIAFYIDALGFEVRVDAQATPTMRWVEVGAPDATVTIALVGGPVTGDVVETGIRFAVPDAEHERTRLIGHGVAVTDLLVWDGVPPMFSFDDPDGNRYVVVEEAR